MNKLLVTLVVILTGLNSIAQVKVGQQAPEISLPGINDSIISLSSFKDKVVLVDFWASWCGPCRRSNPGMARLYKKYKDKGFEVFGVSIDDRKSDWLRAMRQDRINYTQVIDKRGWDAPVTRVYGVDAIPTTFLVDKNGVIVAIDPRGDELEDRVSKLLQ